MAFPQINHPPLIQASISSNPHGRKVPIVATGGPPAGVFKAGSSGGLIQRDIDGQRRAVKFKLPKRSPAAVRAFGHGNLHISGGDITRKLLHGRGEAVLRTVSHGGPALPVHRRLDLVFPERFRLKRDRPARYLIGFAQIHHPPVSRIAVGRNPHG